MKRIVAIFTVLTLCLPVFSESAPLEKCFKSYSKGADDIYMLSISAINLNKYDILEMQSKSGYILFRAFSKDYLLSVSNKTSGSSVKIVPANSNFSGGTGVQDSIFTTLDMTVASGFKKVQ